MADTKTERVPRKFESLPETYVGKREVAGSPEEWVYKKGLMRKKKKDAPDQFALKPVRPKDDAEKSKFLAFLGLELGSELGLRASTQFAVKWSLNSFDKASGLFTPAEFDKCVSTFSARGETISALEEELDELTDEIVLVGKDTTLDMAGKMKRFNEITTRIGEIKDAIAFKKGEGDEEEANVVNG